VVPIIAGQGLISSSCVMLTGLRPAGRVSSGRLQTQVVLLAITLTRPRSIQGPRPPHGRETQALGSIRAAGRGPTVGFFGRRRPHLPIAMRWAPSSPADAGEEPVRRLSMNPVAHDRFRRRGEIFAALHKNLDGGH
jgi:hypothetical protein